MVKRAKPAAIVPVMASSQELSPALAASVEGARKLAAESHSPRTVRAYRAAWAAFQKWCRAHGLASLPADPGTVALYAGDCVDGRAGKHRPQSVDVYLAAIRAYHVSAGHASPCDHEAVHRVMRGARRTHGTRPDKKTPAVVDVIRRLNDALDETQNPYVRQRDRALVLLGFAGALRRSELVALNWGDIEYRAGGALVTVARSKTDQAGRGHTVHVHVGVGSMCPIATVDAWRRGLGELLRGATDAKSPVFVSLSQNSFGDRLAAENVARIVKVLAERAGLDPAKYAGHSLRSGFATEAARRGKSLDKIRAQTRHASLDMLKEYLSDEVPWDDDAGKGLL